MSIFSHSDFATVEITDIVQSHWGCQDGLEILGVLIACPHCVAWPRPHSLAPFQFANYISKELVSVSLWTLCYALKKAILRSP